eukprot:2769899-Amphidinium_carterae.1
MSRNSKETLSRPLTVKSVKHSSKSQNMRCDHQTKNRHNGMSVAYEEMKAALADVVKKARDKGFTVGDTTWSRTPPNAAGMDSKI